MAHRYQRRWVMTWHDINGNWIESKGKFGSSETHYSVYTAKISLHWKREKRNLTLFFRQF